MEHFQTVNTPDEMSQPATSHDISPMPVVFSMPIPSIRKWTLNTLKSRIFLHDLVQAKNLHFISSIINNE